MPLIDFALVPAKVNYDAFVLFYAQDCVRMMLLRLAARFMRPSSILIYLKRDFAVCPEKICNRIILAGVIGL